MPGQRPWRLATQGGRVLAVLVGAQCDQRIEGGGSPRGHERGQQRDRQEQDATAV